MKKREPNLQFDKVFEPTTAFKDLNEDTQLYIICGLAKILTPNKYEAHSKDDMVRYIALGKRMTENIPLHELARLIGEHELSNAKLNE